MSPSDPLYASLMNKQKLIVDKIMADYEKHVEHHPDKRRSEEGLGEDSSETSEEREASEEQQNEEEIDQKVAEKI